MKFHSLPQYLILGSNVLQFFNTAVSGLTKICFNYHRQTETKIPETDELFYFLFFFFSFSKA